MKQRSSHFWEFIVKRSFTERDWYENFRVRKTTFDYLCSKLRPAIKKRNTVLRAAICVEQRVAVCLWCLASSVEYRTVAHLFGISVASVCLIVRNVCKAIVQVLMPKYIRLPKTENELSDVVAGFNDMWGFPNCCGAIDGSHIPISAPCQLRTDYYNRKGWYSVVLQSLVDDKYRFMDMYVGWPGSVHDARVFANSDLYHLGRTGTLFPKRTLELDGVDVPVVILGDSAYPLMSWLLKPFAFGTTSMEQQSFNYRLSRARMVIENAYGRLKGRWRCLLKRLDVHVNNVPVVVAACCTLHNICEIHGEHFDHEWLNEGQILQQPGNYNLHPNHDEHGSDVRDFFVQYINSHPL